MTFVKIGFEFFKQVKIGFEFFKQVKIGFEFFKSLFPETSTYGILTMYIVPIGLQIIDIFSNITSSYAST